MAVNITGSKSGEHQISSYADNVLTLGSGAVVVADFATPRICAFFDSNDSFAAFGHVRSATSTTKLELEYDPIDPITRAPVTITAAHTCLVSLNLSEVASGGLAVTNNEVTVSDKLVFGTTGNEKSLCLYDEDKTIRQTGGAGWTVKGGVTVFSHLLSGKSTDYVAPVNMVFNSGANRFRTSGTAGHFFWFGGSLTAVATPAYFGGYQGLAGGSLLLSKIVISEMDIIAQNIGNWTANSDRHVLRECAQAISKNVAIGIRWGNGVVEGGVSRLKTIWPLAPFGGSYSCDIGAKPDERYIIWDIAGNQLFDSSGSNITINFTNLITSARGFSRNGGTLNFYWQNTFTNIVQDSKLVINRTIDDVNIYDELAPATGELAPLIFEERRVNASSAEIYAAWYFGVYKFGFTPITGTFETTEFSLGAGGAANEVNFGGLVNQLADTLISEPDKSVVDGYPISVALSGDQLTVTGDSSTLQTISSEQIYDAVAAWLEDNYKAESETIITRAGDVLDCRNLNLTLDYIELSGGVTTTALVTLTNGSSASGGIIDQTGNSFLSFDASVSRWTIYQSESDMLSNSSEIESGEGNFRFNFSSETTYYIKLVVSGEYILKQVKPDVQGETVVDMSTTALLGNLSIQVANLRPPILEARDFSQNAALNTSPAPAV